MSQQEVKSWVLVTNVKENINQQDMDPITPQVSFLIDEWQSKGKMMWSGPFDDEA